MEIDTITTKLPDGIEVPLYLVDDTYSTFDQDFMDLLGTEDFSVTTDNTTDITTDNTTDITTDNTTDITTNTTTDKPPATYHYYTNNLSNSFFLLATHHNTQSQAWYKWDFNTSTYNPVQQQSLYDLTPITHDQSKHAIQDYNIIQQLTICATPRHGNPTPTPPTPPTVPASPTNLHLLIKQAQEEAYKQGYNQAKKDTYNKAYNQGWQDATTRNTGSFLDVLQSFKAKQ